MSDRLDPGVPEDPFTIGAIIAQADLKPVWYRRGWVLVAAAVAAVVIASVLVDLPSHTTTSADASDQTSIIDEINNDVNPCAFGIKETFTIYQEMREGSLGAADRAQVPALLRDDQTACSFTSSTIYDLSNVEGTGTPAGKRVGDVVTVATLWATSDALGAIEDIQTLSTNPSNARALANLTKQQVALATDRSQANADVTAAERILRRRLPPPDLPALPHLP